MPSIINASSTGSGGIVQTADASGVLQLQSNGTVALTVDTSANISVGTTTANTVAGNSNARYFAVQGDGTLSSADGRIVLSNPRAYASIVANTTTAGRVYFQLTNGSGGAITDAANIDAIASGSGGASGYGLDIRFVPKQDNGSSAEAARINFGGNLILKGGTATANGTGITFPATQSASSDANCLDDYEEGTFSPVIQSDTTGLFTMTTQYGRYTRVGNLVTFIAYIAWSARPSGGSIAIANYPYTINNGGTTGGNAATAFIVKSANDAVFTNTNLSFDGTTNSATTYVYNFSRGSLIQVNSLSASGFVSFGGSYFATN
jgi:hypothetical protein